MKKHLNLGNARLATQIEKMKKLDKSNLCPFCRKHFEEYHDAPIIKESKYWILTKNDYPYEGSRIHLLLVYTKHIDTLDKMSKEGMLDLLNQIKWLKKKFKIKGASFLLRFGSSDYTGATVTHLHAHLVSGSKRTKNSAPIRSVLGWE